MKKVVRSFVESHALDFVCILETRVQASNKDKIFNSLLPGWRLFLNYDHALLGRIWICGNPEKVSIDVVHSMDQTYYVTLQLSRITIPFGVRPYMLRITKLIEECFGAIFSGVIPWWAKILSLY